jgi:hypothetical protein
LTSEEGCKIILNDYKQVIMDLIAITAHEKTDPILLTAICQFAFDVFEQDSVKDDEEMMGPFFEQLEDMRGLIPYLGGDKYPDLLKMA